MSRSHIVAGFVGMANFVMGGIMLTKQVPHDFDGWFLFALGLFATFWIGYAGVSINTNLDERKRKQGGGVDGDKS